jgi:crotonobetaine/carnitine-CoA ligase
MSDPTGTPRTVDGLLAERAMRLPGRPFLRFAVDGRPVDHTFADVDAAATRYGHGLARLGVRPGDLVAAMVPNCPEAVVLWFALARIGAVHAPVNTAFRGQGLAHVLNLTRARVLVLDTSLVPAVEAVAGALEHLEVVLVRGGADDVAATAAALPRWQVHPLTDLDDTTPVDHPAPREHAGPGSAAGPVATSERDLSLLLFTSGTTGRSKACMLSHRYAVRQAELMVENLGLRPDDVLYCPFPLFHLDASVLTVMPALVLGATAAIGERFSAGGFWDEVRALGATVFDFMGATLALTYKQAERPDDADNPARLGWGVPLPTYAEDFERRFGVRLTELYGLTDAGVPVYTPLDEPRLPGSCGRPIPQYEVRLVGEDGEEVGVGQVGEIVLRPNEPSLIMEGYFGMPAETREAFRDGWFHTRDLATRDADGYLSFVGRRADVIRRRGENISAFEVEEVVLTHPEVLEAAAFAVPSELTESEVMIAVVPRPGARLDPEQLIAFCAPRLARHMLPRYVDVVAQLPRTPTQKVEKHHLARHGITASTWDRGPR